ncbi:MAG: tetratricopeptide repeat protein [Thermomicrobiales bacterium]|nr:tetratricopeptide repeat protein [Thermomicrobiales bacterium]
MEETEPIRRTFLFTDIEGSYRQWERHPDAMPHALAEHDAILQRAVDRCGGRIFKTIGDAVCAVFAEPLDGVRAAVTAQRELFATDWQALGLTQPLTVRMALQTGEAVERDGDFVGLVLNRISRLLRAGHGGQVLLTGSVADEIGRAGLPGVGLRDLGARRLRDVPGANHIYQLEIDGLPHAFPPLETLDAVAHNLPVALNPCLDRESELAEMRHLLLDSPTRLVTLLGPGGIGKTRLALHAATQLIDAFPGGVWFVDLSGIRDASLTATAVASVLGVRIDAGIDTTRALTDTIGEREMLLLLDNCEQIVDGVARFIAHLLPNVPHLRVLATSRVPLELRGEQRIDIGPLPLEKNEMAGPAVQLFIERAQQIRPSFELTESNQESVYEICRRVDGIPLALELAAARVSVLSPEALRTRLSSRLSLLTSTSRDLPERHQTLRAAIEWSYALLSPEEQTAFRALSVFQGGWSLAGAQAVTGSDEVATMEILASLHDKSLVRLSETDDGEPRYSMLETIQEYGYEQLSGSGELEQARSVHADFYVQLTELSLVPIEGGPRQQYWLGVIDREISNIRFAFQWFLDRKAAVQAIDLSTNLWYYWSARGPTSEGQGWLEKSLNLAGELDPLVRASALRRLANICVDRGDLRNAESFYRSSLEIVQGSDDVLGLAQSLSGLGMVAGMQGRSEEEYAPQAEALRLCREHGAKRGMAICLFNLALWARNTGRIDEAFGYYDEALPLQTDVGDEVGLAFNKAYRAQLWADRGEFETAAMLLEDAEQIFGKMALPDGLHLCWLRRSSVESRRGNIARASVLSADAYHAYRAFGSRAWLAEAAETRASVLAETGDFVEAAELLGAANYLRGQSGAAISAVDRPGVENVIAKLRDAMGEHWFTLHWELGQEREMRATWADGTNAVAPVPSASA